MKYEAEEGKRCCFAVGSTQLDISFWCDFLNSVRQFKYKWGTDFVPKDIHVATTVVKTVHGIVLTFPN
jgi:hypothetical protein